MAGTLVHANAEAISAIVLSQLDRPGCPIIYAPSYGGCMDMATGSHCSGTPEAAFQGAAFAQLGRWYGFPTNMMAGISESKLPDAQAGYEKMMVLLLPALAGAHCITQAAGLLDFALSTSYEQMVIDDEICSQVLHLAKGFPIDEEAFALDAIRKVGHGGHYLEHEHTLRHFREALWLPRLADRRQYDQWASDGRKDIAQRAKEKADQILAEHKPVGVSSDRAAEAQKIVSNIFDREGVDHGAIEALTNQEGDQP